MLAVSLLYRFISCTPYCPLSENTLFPMFCLFSNHSQQGDESRLSYSWPEAEGQLWIFNFYYCLSLQPFEEEVLSYCTFLLGTSLDTFVYTVSFSVLC